MHRITHTASAADLEAYVLRCCVDRARDEEASLTLEDDAMDEAAMVALEDEAMDDDMLSNETRRKKKIGRLRRQAAQSQTLAWQGQK